MQEINNNQMKTILFIDDESSWLEVIKLSLKGGPYKIITAEGGEAALKTLHDRTPDLIMSDVRMPEINGFDLFEKIKQDPRLKSVPYVFMSSIDDFDAKRTAKSLGADGYIEKPFESDKMVSIISGFLTQIKNK